MTTKLRAQSTQLLIGAALFLVALHTTPVARAMDTTKPQFASPHAGPIALSPDGSELYVVNTPSDTLDIIDTASQAVIARVPTGVDPVGIGVRPDGREVWVSNHVSDSVSVVDVDPNSPSRYQVIATVTAWKDEGWVTDFDEPVGIAFASNAKAYVALSSRNQIAVVDVATRTVTKQVHVLSQEPRALAVRNDRLYVVPFESSNQTELSGCLNPNAPTAHPGCTFSITELASNSTDIILTRNLVADITRNPDIPDRDLFVYDTADESTLFEVSTLGTLLYGLAIDSTGQVFIAQTEARNDANGLTGTAGHDLPDMENRAFLNQVSRVDCSVDCSSKTIFELEPLPPANPAPGTQLATPFGIQVSADDSTLVSVAASSSRLFTMNASTGAVLGITAVGEIPRGLVLQSAANGSPQTAWVFNAIGNSVSIVDVSTPGSPQETARIALDDPTPADLRQGRILFNDAALSTTETFSCGSCHPDAHTDQLLWALGARCDLPGCDQVQPRSTMPVRGLRDTLPLHWDGVPGDPFGGTNAQTVNTPAPPNCTDEHSCFRNLVDGSLSGTMCDQSNCPTNLNELGLAGALEESDRDALAIFIRSVLITPARSRRMDDRFSDLGAEGFRNFLIGIDEEHPGCSRAGGCHSLPFWAGTNTPGTGMDAPTFRGIPDRTLLTPNGRQALWATASIPFLNPTDWNPAWGYDELFAWGLGFGTEPFPVVNRLSSGTGPFQLFQLFEEGGFGVSATFGRQATLNSETAALGETAAIVDRLEEAADDGIIVLHADGGENGSGTSWDPLALEYSGGTYTSRDGGNDSYTRAELEAAAQNGSLVVTLTGRLGPDADAHTPQPAIWLPRDFDSQAFLAKMPEVDVTPAFTLFGAHIASDAHLIVDGRVVDGNVSCEVGGTFPYCDELRVSVAMDAVPAAFGDHTFQIGTPQGLISNEILLIRVKCPLDATGDSMQCGLAQLTLAMEDKVGPGRFRDRLQRLLGRARFRADQAVESLESGDLRRAQTRLNYVTRRLRFFDRRVNGRLGRRELSEADRTALCDEAAALRDDVLALRETL